MEKHQIIIDIATCGWEGEIGQGFYPADLPEDWRLDYYSNEFRAVVVPVDVWQGLSLDMLEEWQDAVHDEFRFYFETTNGLIPSSEIQEMLNSLGEQFGGWVCRGKCDLDGFLPSIWYEGAAQPRQMREAIEKLDAVLGSSRRGVIVVSSTNGPNQASGPSSEAWQLASDIGQLIELMGYG